MPWSKVTPVLLECTPGSLCAKRYPGHTKGCPNFGKRATCPPQADVLTPYLIASHDWYAIWNVFPFGQHVLKMIARHPDWSRRQLECCLYWQGTARKQLAYEIGYFHGHTICEQMPVPLINRIPEAHGVNVTATMQTLGIELEWPPQTVTYQVALAALLREGL